MNGSSMCLRPAPTDIPSRMPSPSSYVEPSVMSLALSAGVYAATISGFITKPPAAITVAPARTTPASPKEREAGRAGLVPHLDAGLLDPVAQQVHHQLRSPSVPRHRDLVPARCRGTLGER